VHVTPQLVTRPLLHTEAVNTTAAQLQHKPFQAVPQNCTLNPEHKPALLCRSQHMHTPSPLRRRLNLTCCAFKSHQDQNPAWPWQSDTPHHHLTLLLHYITHLHTTHKNSHTATPLKPSAANPSTIYCEQNAARVSSSFAGSKSPVTTHPPSGPFSSTNRSFPACTFLSTDMRSLNCWMVMEGGGTTGSLAASKRARVR